MNKEELIKEERKRRELVIKKEKEERKEFRRKWGEKCKEDEV